MSVVNIKRTYMMKPNEKPKSPIGGRFGAETWFKQQIPTTLRASGRG
jgi:hypothetical protein